MTAGSDCSIYLWDLENMQLVNKIPNHSVPIVAVAACELLDLGVSVDEEGTISVVAMSERRILHVFPMGGGITRKLGITRNGVIVVGSNEAVAFYDLAGRRLGKVEVPGMVQMEVIEADDSNAFVAITTMSKRMWVVDVAKVDVCKKCLDPVDPEFLSEWGPRTVAVVARRQEVEEITPVEF
jgi:hypothetical protein